MTIAIWQPYFFPYIGYFQLVNLADRFIFFNDVNFIKKGYIHRNTLLSPQGDYAFSVPLSNASQNKLICEIDVAESFPLWKASFLKTLYHIYGKSNYFAPVSEIIDESLSFKTIDEIAQASVKLTCSYLGLNKIWLKSSEMNYDRTADPSIKVALITAAAGGSRYINSANGRSIYKGVDFENLGLDLSFLQPDQQALTSLFGGEQWKYSMLHLLFHYSPEQINLALGMYNRSR